MKSRIKSSSYGGEMSFKFKYYYQNLPIPNRPEYSTISVVCQTYNGHFNFSALVQYETRLTNIKNKVADAEDAWQKAQDAFSEKQKQNNTSGTPTSVSWSRFSRPLHSIFLPTWLLFTYCTVLNEKYGDKIFYGFCRFCTWSWYAELKVDLKFKYENGEFLLCRKCSKC